ncbi:MAG: hypothetical protein ACOX0N_03385 [Syntrophomonadaceae bacterium]|jgi:hypothetical protein|nr:hypothetical protein [Syntrophomonadaceae bacterium]
MMNLGPWEIVFILLLIGLLVLPLLVVLKMLSMEKRMAIIEEQLQKTQQEEDSELF